MRRAARRPGWGVLFSIPILGACQAIFPFAAGQDLTSSNERPAHLDPVAPLDGPPHDGPPRSERTRDLSGGDVAWICPSTSLWNPAVVVGTNAATANTTIALDSGGKPRIAYHAYVAAAPNEGVRYAWYQLATPWPSKAVVTNLPGLTGNSSHSWTSLALGAGDIPYVTYHFQNGTAPCRLEYATQVGAWTTASIAEGGTTASLGLDGLGTVHVVYSLGMNADLFHAALPSSISTVLYAGQAAHPSMAVDPAAAELHVAYNGGPFPAGSSLSLMYTWFRPGAASVNTAVHAANVPVCTSFLDCGDYPAIARDKKTGNLYIAFVAVSGTTRQLKLATGESCTGGACTWSVEDVAPGDYPSLALSVAATINISFRNPASKSLVYARRSMGGNKAWEPVETIEAGAGRFSSLAINSTGEAHLVYLKGSSVMYRSNPCR